ncbi:MAG: PrsW family intramembrane metalloprotease [Candidatus Micrarchaeota archaeon]|nr:PrsW family intramembrane metalloprotease [Candidatus Micrarchaeota archaeon]
MQLTKYCSHKFSKIYFIFFLIFCFNFIFPASIEEDNQQQLQNLKKLDFSYGLKHEIKIEPAKLVASPSTINISITIFNDYDKDLIIYLYSKTDEGYELEQILGVAPKNKKSVFKYYIIADYHNQKIVKNSYAILAKGYIADLGFYFDVVQDWSEYEKGKYLEILNNSRFLIPLGGVLILLLISLIAVLNFYFLHKSKKLTLFNFLLYDTKKFSFQIFVSSPIFWFIYILISALIFNFVFKLLKVSAVVLLLSFLFCLLVAVLFFSLIWLYSLIIQRLSFRYLIGGFVWGVFSASIALSINSLLVSSSNFALPIFFVVCFILPAIEEFLKGLGIFFLYNKEDFRALDGLFVGLTIGFGFAFIENFFVFSSNPTLLAIGEFSWASLIIYRTIFGFLSHSSFSSIFGFIFFWLKEHFFKGFSLAIFFNSLLFAVVLHSLFNISSSLDGIKSINSGFYLFEYNPTISLLAIGLSLVLLLFATIDKKYYELNKIKSK